MFTKPQLGRGLDIAIDLSSGPRFEIWTGGAEGSLDRAGSVAHLGQTDRGGEVSLVRVRDPPGGTFDLSPA
jgi:hypothetical protein